MNLLVYRAEYLKFHYNLAFWALILTNVLYNLVSKYLFNLWEFLPYLMISIGLDLVTGIMKAYNMGELILSKGLRKTINKFIQYGAFLIVAHILSNGNLFGKSQKYLEWLPETAIIYLILTELKSTLENISGENKNIPTGPIISFIKKILRSSKLSSNNTNTNNNK